MFKLNERTNILVAIIALSISLINAFVQFGHYLRGPDVNLISNNYVIIDYNIDAKGYKILRLSVPMAYINDGPTGQSDIITNESVAIKFGEREYKMKWQYFVKSSWSNENLSYKIEKKASAFPIKGGESHAHETLFYPYVEVNDGKISGDNYLVWEEFTKYLKKQEEVVVDISFKSHKKEGKKTSCKLLFYPNILDYFYKDRGAPVQCTPRQPPTYHPVDPLSPDELFSLSLDASD